jgi:hypothetical protein
MKVFITFGAGGPNYIDAAKRLIKQAKLTGYFDKIILYTESDLQNDKGFWNKHSLFISENKRGYGYWIWKSYIIKKTMETMTNGDILLYLDCGCEIGLRSKKFLPVYFNYVIEDKIIGTTTFIEKEWCKMDLLMHFDMQDSDLIHTPQHQAGALMFYVCSQTRFVVDLWYNTGNNYHLIDDSESIEKNLDCFKEHRHDQAIFSLITKKYNIYSNKSLDYCIYYLRNKSGSSLLKHDMDKLDIFSIIVFIIVTVVIVGIIIIGLINYTYKM